jgi:hypothetical protein
LGFERRECPGGDLSGAVSSALFYHAAYLRALSVVGRYAASEANMK